MNCKKCGHEWQSYGEALRCPACGSAVTMTQTEKQTLWEEAYEAEKAQMPTFDVGKSTDTAWLRKMEDIAQRNLISLGQHQAEAEVDADDVKELPVKVRSVTVSSTVAPDIVSEILWRTFSPVTVMDFVTVTASSLMFSTTTTSPFACASSIAS